eukprot:Seg588.5 transcript_id=Seg588.5/GoldUCD/mRNA.D3Y31 product="hypothetical protein" protein_id=Seg588.5/GoldUCD/D3Y31
MESLSDYDEFHEFSGDEILEQLNSDLIKESEILDEETDFALECEEVEVNRPVFVDEEDLFIDEELEIHEKLNETKEINAADVKVIEKNQRQENVPTSSPSDRAANSLLRKTIAELERALTDTNKLLTVRDAENNKVRTQLMSLEKDLEAEQLRCKGLEESLTEKNEIINDLEKTIENDRKETESLKLWVENNKEATTIDFVKETICATPEEIDKIREINIEQEKQILDLKMKLATYVEMAEKANNETVKQKQLAQNDPRSKCRHLKKERDLQTKLRMKFMRDAFFYFMIDYHAEEQLRAIIAILEYEDKRQDIIIESHRMRQKGRKFSVSQVSSRKLTFVQEEHR